MDGFDPHTHDAEGRMARHGMTPHPSPAALETALQVIDALLASLESGRHRLGCVAGDGVGIFVSRCDMDIQGETLVVSEKHVQAFVEVLAVALATSDPVGPVGFAVRSHIVGTDREIIRTWVIKMGWPEPVVADEVAEVSDPELEGVLGAVFVGAFPLERPKPGESAPGT